MNQMNDTLFFVIAGLDPAIQELAANLDARVKPENDYLWVVKIIGTHLSVSNH